MFLKEQHYCLVQIDRSLILIENGEAHVALNVLEKAPYTLFP